MPPADLARGWPPAPTRTVRVIRGAGIPPRRRRSRPRGRGPDRSARRVSPAGPLLPGPLRDKLADATGYPLPAPFCAKPTPVCAISVPLTPVNHGQQRGTVARPDHRSRPPTTQRAQPSKLAMPVRSRSPAPPWSAGPQRQLQQGQDIFVPRAPGCSSRNLGNCSAAACT